MSKFRASFGASLSAPEASIARDGSCGRATDGVRWQNDGRTRSAADPDTLARAVQAHKAGDVFAQAMLTLALMLAIGAVAVVLSVEQASAAGMLVRGVLDHSAHFAAIAVVGGALLLATRATLRQMRERQVRVRVRDRQR